ncbi:MAG TPA: hypothetical protein VFZ16_16865 [Hyphomicrobiaceae bacterium]|nr:hypothetical protein [Hyphomicrobiaceae bacterium]
MVRKAAKATGIAVGIAVLVGLILMERPPSRINPAVFQAFRDIEGACLWEPWRMAGCRGALDASRLCHGARADGDRCTPVQYYCRLEQLGFALPPFWMPGEPAALADPCGTQ